ncbi:MFS transporter [Janibacter limosus]|uniref:MFS transporter n=1 Tax=Janibacter limosus TaxID=53458 RepID=A0AC61U448_9MICO|nr:MFS transporter [Janibacter limosus]UUZ44771.1 MFS transporter [Janibacter limosus]
MTTTTPDARPTTTGSGVVGLMAALLSAIFAFQLSASMLSPVLATMERELEATSAQWGVTQTAFFASAALFSLFLPRWGDLVGRKRLMLGMLAVTTVGSVVSALAPSVGVLGPGRVVMGISGPIVPMALIMLRVQVPDARRYAQLMAVLTAVNGGIAGVDALAGGWLAASWGFRSVFWAMAAVSVIALVAVALGTRESRSGAHDAHGLDGGHRARRRPRGALLRPRRGRQGRRRPLAGGPRPGGRGGRRLRRLLAARAAGRPPARHDRSPPAATHPGAARDDPADDVRRLCGDERPAAQHRPGPGRRHRPRRRRGVVVDAHAVCARGARHGPRRRAAGRPLRLRGGAARRARGEHRGARRGPRSSSSRLRRRCCWESSSSSVSATPARATSCSTVSGSC